MTRGFQYTHKHNKDEQKPKEKKSTQSIQNLPKINI